MYRFYEIIEIFPYLFFTSIDHLYNNQIRQNIFNDKLSFLINYQSKVLMKILNFIFNLN